MGIIKGTTGFIEKIKRHSTFIGEGKIQESPVHFKKDVVERNGQNMKDKKVEGTFGHDSVTSEIYTKHPSMHQEIAMKNKGAENIEKSHDTEQA